MKRNTGKFPGLIILLILIGIIACENNYQNIIDDERILGTWHRKSYIENGITTDEQDSIVYHFLDDGRMKVRYFSTQTASPPDEDYQFDFQEGILRYWNSDFNVSEENQVYFYGSRMRIQVYQNYYYELIKLF